nr:ATP-binding protein [Duffyella gerundensis]
MRRVIRAVVWLTFFSFTFTAQGEHAPVELISRTSIAQGDPQLTAASEAWLAVHPALHVAIWGNAHPPLLQQPAESQWEGIAADYINAIAQALKKPVIVHHYPDFNAARQALARGEVTLLALYSPALNEENQWLVSQPWILDNLVVMHDRRLTRQDQATMPFKTLGMIQRGQLEARTRLHWPAITLSSWHHYANAVAALQYQQIHGVLLNRATAQSLLQYNHKGDLRFFAPPFLQDLSLSFATDRAHEPLMDAVNQVLTAMPLAAKIRIASNWGLDASFVTRYDPLNLSKEEKQWLQQHRSVDVVLPRAVAPFSYIDRYGHQTGLVQPLLTQITQRSGIVFRTLTAGAADHAPTTLLVASVAHLSPHNDAQLSRPYARSPWVLVTSHQQPARLLQRDAHFTVAIPAVEGLAQALLMHYPLLHIVTAEDAKAAYGMLDRGRVNAVIDMQISAEYWVNHDYPNRMKLTAPLRMAPAAVAFRLQQGDPMLLAIINKVLTETSPQEQQRELANWQHGPEMTAYLIWDLYSRYFLQAVAIALLIIALIYWRNRHLQQRLQIKRDYARQLQLAKSDADHANAMKSRFLSRISHEIRTPLNALTGLLELEHHQISVPEQRQKNIAVAWQAANTLMALVGDLLDLARIEAGKLEISLQEVDLAAALENAHQLFAASAEEKGLQLQLRCDITQRVVLFDGTKLHQILSNLLSNAVRYSDSGTVFLSLTQQAGSDRYSLHVRDSGPGITAAQQQAIFEPFIRLDNDHPAQGTGLGLNICRELATLLGGELTLESEENVGSTFCFSFTAAPASALASERLQTAHARVAPLRVLIVDDHQPNRLLLKQQLAAAGHQAIEASRGEQALTLWRDQTFDLVITDCHMPGMDGFALAQAIRQTEQQRGVAPCPLFGYTAQAEEAMKQRALAAGMDDCLFKPLRLATLLACVNQYGPRTPLPLPQESGVLATLKTMTGNDPQALAEIVATLIEANRQDSERLQQAFQQQQLERVASLAHRLLGSARMVQHQALIALCSRLQKVSTLTVAERSNAIVGCVALLAALELELQPALTCDA